MVMSIPTLSFAMLIFFALINEKSQFCNLLNYLEALTFGYITLRDLAKAHRSRIHIWTWADEVLMGKPGLKRRNAVLKNFFNRRRAWLDHSFSDTRMVQC